MPLPVDDATDLRPLPPNVAPSWSKDCIVLRPPTLTDPVCCGVENRLERRPPFELHDPVAGVATE